MMDLTAPPGLGPTDRDTSGRGLFVLVAGPSGAGKDTLMAAMVTARPSLTAARRVITRAGDAGGEAHEEVSAAAFERLEAAGGLMLSWRAHGLGYGLPVAAEEALRAGRDVVANVSRAVIPAARARFGPILALHVTAPREVLAARLAARGRESAAEIAERLARAPSAAPDGPDVVEIDNGGALEAATRDALAAIDAAKARGAGPVSRSTPRARGA